MMGCHADVIPSWPALVAMHEHGTMPPDVLHIVKTYGLTSVLTAFVALERARRNRRRADPYYAAPAAGVPRSQRPRCGARCRDGHACLAPGFHEGAADGAACTAGARRGRERWRGAPGVERRRSRGGPGGGRRGRRREPDGQAQRACACARRVAVARGTLFPGWRSDNASPAPRCCARWRFWWALVSAFGPSFGSFSSSGRRSSRRSTGESCDARVASGEGRQRRGPPRDGRGQLTRATRARVGRRGRSSRERDRPRHDRRYLDASFSPRAGGGVGRPPVDRAALERGGESGGANDRGATGAGCGGERAGAATAGAGGCRTDLRPAGVGADARRDRARVDRPRGSRPVTAAGAAR